jgi:hypothetical protein
LLDRLDALEGAPEREATRAADKAALETLAQRGIDAAVRGHLRALVEQAGVAHDPVPAPERPMAEDREQALRALAAWYADWSETARAAIQRRDYLVMLGLASRRQRKEQEPETNEGEITIDSPLVAPAA